MQLFLEQLFPYITCVLSHGVKFFNLLTTNVPIIQKQSVCSANQLTGFYMMGTLVVKRLRYCNHIRSICSTEAMIHALNLIYIIDIKESELWYQMEIAREVADYFICNTHVLWIVLHISQSGGCKFRLERRNSYIYENIIIGKLVPTPCVT